MTRPTPFRNAFHPKRRGGGWPICSSIRHGCPSPRRRDSLLAARSHRTRFARTLVRITNRRTHPSVPVESDARSRYARFVVSHPSLPWYRRYRSSTSVASPTATIMVTLRTLSGRHPQSELTSAVDRRPRGLPLDEKQGAVPTGTDVGWPIRGERENPFVPSVRLVRLHHLDTLLRLNWPTLS